MIDVCTLRDACGQESGEGSEGRMIYFLARQSRLGRAATDRAWLGSARLATHGLGGHGIAWSGSAGRTSQGQVRHGAAQLRHAGRDTAGSVLAGDVGPGATMFGSVRQGAAGPAGFDSEWRDHARTGGDRLGAAGEVSRHRERLGADWQGGAFAAGKAQPGNIWRRSAWCRAVRRGAASTGVAGMASQGAVSQVREWMGEARCVGAAKSRDDGNHLGPISGALTPRINQGMQ